MVLRFLAAGETVAAVLATVDERPLLRCASFLPCFSLPFKVRGLIQTTQLAELGATERIVPSGHSLKRNHGEGWCVGIHRGISNPCPSFSEAIKRREAKRFQIYYQVS
jgi:hypothetical protein